MAFRNLSTLQLVLQDGNVLGRVWVASTLGLPQFVFEEVDVRAPTSMLPVLVLQGKESVRG